jgi:hypothetical protein
MFLLKVKIAAALLVTLSVVAVSAAVVVPRLPGGSAPTAWAAAAPAPEKPTPPATEERPEQGKTEPAGLPLEARLVARKRTYILDPNLKQAIEQYRDAVKKAGGRIAFGTPLPAAPQVDLDLVIRNTGTRELNIWGIGDATQFVIDLKGPGAVTEKYVGAMTYEIRLPPTITVAPGKEYTFAFNDLSWGVRSLSRAYWTEPGSYTLSISFHTAMNPPPKGSQKAGKGLDGGALDFGRIVITSNPVKLKVEAR